LTTYTGIGKIDGGDNVYFLDGPKIQVAQPRYGYTARFRGMTDITFVYCSTVLLWVLFYSDTVSTVTVTDYLVVRPGYVLGIWAVVQSMCNTHLKHRQRLQPISFNNLGLRLTRVIDVVWDASITVGIHWHN